jgi:hypothetical protein
VPFSEGDGSWLFDAELGPGVKGLRSFLGFGRFMNGQLLKRVD